MSLSLPQSKLYVLAEQVRTKFDKAANAKDQHLSRLLAHAHLYDELDDHLEKLRMKRTSSPTSAPVQVVPVPTTQEEARPQEQQDDDNSGLSESTAKGTFHKWDLINECAILDDDEDEEIPSRDRADEGPLIVDGQAAPAEGDILTRLVHALPAAISDTPTDKTAKDMYPTTVDAQVTVFEVPIDDEDDSDFESDSDCDTLVDQDEQTATTMSILKPNAPYHNIDLKFTSKPIEDLDEADTITSNDTFPALERSKPSSQLATPYDNQLASPISLKTSPLAPQLCGSSSCADVSAPIYQDLRLQQAMLRLLRYCRTSNERTISEEQ
ncbi:MAG: hypothetical protein Q9212_002054 [Teloschistes hypoglaucus]